VHCDDRKWEIELLRLGQRVTTYPKRSHFETLQVMQGIEARQLRSITLVHIRNDGTRVEIALLRSLDWIEDYGAHVGGSVFLDMPEMGVEGLAEVAAIEPCPPLEEGEGRLVTGTFKHTSGEVYDLKLESESKPIGVTATHPFWSVDRNTWVSAIDLEIGETLKTLAGTTVVESRSKREEPETVYNIEVEGDHCYRVGESGVLVHNASCGQSLWDVACKLANAAAGDSDEFGGTVAVGCTCDGKIVVATTRRRSLIAIREAAGPYTSEPVIVSAGRDHAEETLANMYDLAAVAASRCVCHPCQDGLRNVTIESPVTTRGVVFGERPAHPSSCIGAATNSSVDCNDPDYTPG